MYPRTQLQRASSPPQKNPMILTGPRERNSRKLSKPSNSSSDETLISSDDEQHVVKVSELSQRSKDLFSFGIRSAGKSHHVVGLVDTLSGISSGDGHCCSNQGRRPNFWTLPSVSSSALLGRTRCSPSWNSLSETIIFLNLSCVTNCLPTIFSKLSSTPTFAISIFIGPSCIVVCLTTT